MYYLPVNISERRIHICELSNEKTDPVFGFLFTGDTLFQTSPYGRNELIADHGENLDLEDYHFDVRREGESDGRPIYGFFIEKDCKGGGLNGGELHHHVAPDVPFCIDPDNESFRNTGVKVKFVRKGAGRIVEDAFIVSIHYITDGEDFCYSFKGYLATSGETGNIVDAAIDFGSEASQIKVGETRIPINEVLYENFYKEMGWPGVSVENVNADLWQSDPNPQLYRSTYFVHREPKQTKFAETPNINGAETYVHAQLPLGVEKSYYKNLLLLPNLKLMDMIGDANRTMQTTINVPQGSDLLRNTLVSNLTDYGFRQNTLRLILSNLLHCIITYTTADTEKNKRYLRLVMLMPNVYDQKKVYGVIEGLYRDFDTIAANEVGAKKFHGLEVAVISESDASFLGALQKHKYIIKNDPDAPHQYFLIVDAGKGTTDFSVLQASNGNTCVWNSLYRGGLPASGHALTYAIYEAIWAFFKRKKNIDIDEFLRSDDVDRARVLRFMNHLENLKANYSTYKVQPDSKIELADCSSLSDVITNIEKKIIEPGYLVEGTREIMEEKVKEMSQIVVGSIKRYMTSTHKGGRFGRVFLTGRAFMLDVFMKTLVEKLESEGLAGKDCAKSFNGDELKKICLDGSTAIGSEFFVNNNSELICRPTVTNHWFKGPMSFMSRLSRLSKKLGDLLNGGVSDDSFYYEGIEVENSKNALMTMGVGTRWINDVEHIYYVGRGLLGKLSNGNNEILELTRENVDDRNEYMLIERLIKESLFPYHPSSICAKNTHRPLYPKEESSVQQSEDAGKETHISKEQNSNMTVHSQEGLKTQIEETMKGIV